MPKKEQLPQHELTQLLFKRQLELNSLLEITEAINSNSSPSVLFKMLELILKMHLKIGRMRLLVKEEEHYYCAAKFGGVNESRSTLYKVCQALQGLQEIEFLVNHQNKFLNNYEFFVPVFHKCNMLAFVLIGDFETKPELKDNDLKFIQTMINVIIVALENKKLFKESLYQKCFQRDMELAREVQNMLVPLVLPVDKRVEVASLYLQSGNLGGDYFDFIRLNEHEFLWCIADVSGKGMPAALLMANFQASLRAWVSVEHDLAKLITKLNQIVKANTCEEHFITLFLAKYNQRNREMHYVNAGHNAPILMINGEAFFLKKGTTIIGAFEELPFINIGSVKLPRNSLIFNYTDGLVESADEDIFITDDELISHLKANQLLPAEYLNKKILKDIRASHKAKMDTDDITILSIRIF